MENQQLVDYIHEQMRVGHSEATLHEHLLAHGWQAAAIDGAFTKYHRSNAAELKAARAARKKARRRKWTVLQWGRAGVLAVITIALVLTAGGRIWQKNKHPVLVEAKPLSYQQKQANDVNVVAGAVAQYTLAAGSLPTIIGAVQSGAITICGADCGSVVSSAVTLTAYKPEGVKFAPYTPGLTAPDQNTMYLVPGAKCANGKTLGTTNSNPRSIVILYAQQISTNLSQHCVVL